MKRMKTIFRIGVLAGLVLLCGCMADKEKDKKKEPVQEDRFAFLRKDEFKPIPAKRETLDTETVRDAAVKGPEKNESKLKLAESRTNLGKSAKKKDPPAPFYENFILLNGDEQLTVSLVFNSAPLLDVIPAFADVLGFNFAADSDIKSVVTLNLNSKMTRRELWNTFDRILTLCGASAAVDESLLRIMPASKFSQRGDLLLPTENGDTEVCYFPLRTATAKEAAVQIKPFVTKDAVCMELTAPNALLICDERSNIAKLRNILEILDGNPKSTWPRAVIKCENILPSKITDELRTVLPVLGFRVTQTTDKTESPGAIQLTGIDRLQLIVTSAATQETVSEIRKWVEILDGAISLDQERVFVYKVMHNKADQLVKALSAIYNTTATSLTVDTNTGSSRTETVNSQNSNTARSRTTASNANPAQTVNSKTNTETDQSSSIFDNPVRVFSDGVLNRLVIRTTPRTYASIKALLDRLDIVPAQVLLQVMVVEVTLKDSTQFGLELSAATKVAGENVTMGQRYTNLNPFVTDNGTLKQAATDQGFHFLLSDPNNPDSKFAYIRALAGNTRVKVVSCPQVLVSSNTEAMITVGSRIPYTTSAITDTASSNSSSTSFVSNVDFKDTGITLTITPQITSTDFIGLEVKQELTSAIANTLTNVDAPEFPTRVVETNMTIQNGKTMVIGGLIQEEKNDSLDSIPIINSIPILRRLFGSTDASVKRSEILVLITGHIVNEKSKVDDMIKRYDDALRALNDFDYQLGDRPGANQRMCIFDNEDFGYKPRPGKAAK